MTILKFRLYVAWCDEGGCDASTGDLLPDAKAKPTPAAWARAQWRKRGWQFRYVGHSRSGYWTAKCPEHRS